jgi:hypothetical protein
MQHIYGRDNNEYIISDGTPERKRQLVRSRRNRKIILKCILKKLNMNSMEMASYCEHGNKPSGSIKAGQSLTS